jgi:hypothetical protein
MLLTSISFAQIKPTFEAVIALGEEAYKDQRDFLDMRSGFRGNDNEFATDLYATGQLTEATTEALSQLLYMYLKGDQAYRENIQEFAEFQRKGYLMKIKSRTRNVLLVQGRNRNPAINSYCEKLRSTLRKLEDLTNSLDFKSN